MPGPVSSPPQIISDSPVLRPLRRLLVKSGFCDARIAPTLENVSPPIPETIAPGSSLHTLLTLFYAGQSVTPKSLQDAIRPLTLKQILSTGFCSREHDQIVPNVFIQPYGKLLFAKGLYNRFPGPQNVVMQISITSLELAHLMNPQRVRTALDLGTGCGFLASQLSPRADHVYALDLNPRAVQFAALNSHWNSLSNITCLQGNLFEPVRDRRFDLIVCNPPFFICPVVDSDANRFLFQHSGMEGDSFCLNLARTAPQFLNEGGYFHMMFSWMQVEKQDWHSRLSATFADIGCDAWCLRTEEQSIEEYVAFWCDTIPATEKMDLETLSQRGLDYFKSHNISSVGTGLLTLRRCTSRPNHIWFDDAPDDRSEPYGASIAQLFDLRAKCDNLSDEDFLQLKLSVAPNVASIQKSVTKNRQWKAIASELCRDSGLKYTFSGADPLISEIVTTLDGRTSLRQSLNRLSRKRHLSLQRVISAHLPHLRELLRYGFLLPESSGRRTTKSR